MPVTWAETRLEAGTGRELFQLRPDQLQTETSGDRIEHNKTQDNTNTSGDTEELLLKERVFPKKGTYILYKKREDNVWFRAQVIKKGLKASNPMPYYNVQPEFDKQQKGINLDEFDWVFDSPESAKDKIIFDGNITKSTSTDGSSPKLRRSKEHSVLFTTNYAAKGAC